MPLLTEEVVAVVLPGDQILSAEQGRGGRKNVTAEYHVRPRRFDSIAELSHPVAEDPGSESQPELNGFFLLEHFSQRHGLAEIGQVGNAGGQIPPE